MKMPSLLICLVEIRNNRSRAVCLEACDDCYWFATAKFYQFHLLVSLISDISSVNSQVLNHNVLN